MSQIIDGRIFLKSKLLVSFLLDWIHIYYEIY